jgi:hypothetical protein
MEDMFFLNRGDSLDIAKKLIRNTGLEESLALLKQKNHSGAVEPEELLRLVLSLSACNLVRTMREDFVVQEIMGDDQQDIIDDYIVESIRKQKLVKLRDGAEIMERCEAVEAVAGELQRHWFDDDDPKGPGPRYYCVKDVLRRLGDETNHELQDSLFEFMYLQHKYFIDFFKDLFKSQDLPGSPPKTPGRP